MTNWTLTAKLPGEPAQSESFEGQFAWCDARDALVDAYLDNQKQTHQALSTLLCDGDPEEPVHLSIDGIVLTLLPTQPRYTVYSVDNGTAVVLDTKHDLEVAVCNRYHVENPDGAELDEVEVDNGHERAAAIALVLNLCTIDLPGPADLLELDGHQPANVDQATVYPPLLEVIEALPARSDDEYEWSDRSSTTSCAVALIKKLPPSTQKAVAMDVLDFFQDEDDAPRFSWHVNNGTYYEFTPENDAARALLGDQRTLEGLPSSEEVIDLLARAEALGGVIVDDCEEKDITIPEFRAMLAEQQDLVA